MCATPLYRPITVGTPPGPSDAAILDPATARLGVFVVFLSAVLTHLTTGKVDGYIAAVLATILGAAGCQDWSDDPSRR